MKIKKQLRYIGGSYAFDGLKLDELKGIIETWEKEYPGWDALSLDISLDYDDCPEYHLMGEREETEEERQARILTANAYADSLRANELAQLAALKAKYEQ